MCLLALGGGGKFSITPKVEEELDLLSSTCYWSLRIEEALTHSSVAARLASPRHDTPRVAGLSRAKLTLTRLFLPVTNGEFSDSWATI